MSRSAGRYFINWWSDSLRFVGALLYWNARKTAYVRRGRHGPCPCHNPSDDAVPGRVRCNAVLMWEQPERFRRVCPLLVRTEYGWCCSVAPNEVRPFWGAAFRYLFGSLLAAYLIAVLGGFVFFRQLAGTPVTLAQVAWPTRWPEIRALQAEQFFQRALVSFRRGELNAAFLELVSARNRDSHHYPAALLVAQISMFQGSEAFADEQFDALLRSHPELRLRTAIAYHDTLLAAGRLRQFAGLNLRMAALDRDHAPQWVHSLLFALRHRTDVAALLDLEVESYRQLDPTARLLVQAESQIAAGDRAGAIRALRAPLPADAPLVYRRAQIERLAELKATRDAQLLLDAYGPALREFETLLLQFTIDSIGGDTWSARAAMRRLLEPPLTVEQARRVAERLIVYPAPERFQQLQAKMLKSQDGELRALAPTMWVAALANDLPGEAALWRAESVRVKGERFPDLAAVEFASRELRNPASVLNVINAVTLPREVVFALLVRTNGAVGLAAGRLP